MSASGKPSPICAPVQRRVLGVLSHEWRTTRAVAEAAGVSHKQAKNALGYLYQKGRVTRLPGTWACSWALPGAVRLDTYENDEDWTPQPWVHPIRARALGLPVRGAA